MIAVAARTPAPIKTVRWASSCEALILDTGAVEREELCDSPSSIRLEATQQLREARAFVHRQAATSLCERGLRAAELAEEHGRLKDAELILGAIVAQLRRRMATQEIATWMDRQRRRLATVDAEIERKTEEHRRRRAAEMAALNAKGGPRMLEMPVLVRTPSLEELQADDDELDVPAEAATVVPGTPPGMAQLLTRISSQRNDENVAPSDEDTPAATRATSRTRRLLNEKKKTTRRPAARTRRLRMRTRRLRMSAPTSPPPTHRSISRHSWRRTRPTRSR